MFAVWFPRSFMLVFHDEGLAITPVPCPESIDHGGSICCCFNTRWFYVRPSLSTRPAGYMGESCSVLFRLGRHRCLLYMGWDGQGGVAHLLYAVAGFGGICVRGEHVQTGKKNLTVFSVRKKPPEMSSMQELIVPESLFFKRLAFQGSFACECSRNRWRSSADALDVILKILMWFSAWHRRESNAEQEEKEKMAASQVNVLSWVRGCLLFLLKCHGLRTCKPFIFYFWCSCLVRLFSTSFFFFVDSQSALYFSRVPESLPIVCIQAPHKTWKTLSMN